MTNSIPNRDPITGRNKLTFETPEQFDAAVNEYLSYICSHKTDVMLATGIVKKPIYPTVEGLAKYLDVDPDTISRYGKRSGYDAIYRKFKAHSLDELKQLGLCGTYAPAVAIFLLKNDHGLRDQIDINAQVLPEFKPALTAEEILSRIPDSISNKLLEE